MSETVTDAAVASGRMQAELVARLDRLPVWPYPWSVPVVVGMGFFFSFFDVINIGFALPVITQQFGISPSEASWAITSGLVGYIVGSLGDSLVADRFGRRFSLILSVSAFSLGSILAATSSSLLELVGWRFLAGMGIGAEIALVTTYMAELSPAPLRGRYTGWSIVAGFVGFAVVPFLSLALIPNYEWGWRALFAIGGLGGFLVLPMRRGIPRSPRWLLEQGRVSEAEAVLAEAEATALRRMGVGETLPAPVVAQAAGANNIGPSMLQAPYIGRLILLGVVWFLYYVGNYGWLTLAPELLAKAGFGLKQDMASLSMTGLGFVAGSVFAVWANDRFERKWMTAVAALVWAASLFGIGYFASLPVVAVAGFVASFTIGLVIPTLYTYTGENFPTRFRATGIAVTDGVGHLGGAFCGQIIFALYGFAGFSGAFAAMAVTGLLTAALVSLGTPTTARPLDEVSP